jgi:hypothetical protein
MACRSVSNADGVRILTLLRNNNLGSHQERRREPPGCISSMEEHSPIERKVVGSVPTCSAPQAW